MAFAHGVRQTRSCRHGSCPWPARATATDGDSISTFMSAINHRSLPRSSKRPVSARRELAELMHILRQPYEEGDPMTSSLLHHNIVALTLAIGVCCSVVVVTSTWIIGENESGLVIKKFGPAAAVGPASSRSTARPATRRGCCRPDWHFGCGAGSTRSIKVPVVVVAARRDRARRRRGRRGDSARARARARGRVRQLPGRGGVPAQRRRARPPARRS